LPLNKLAEDADLRIELSSEPLLHFKIVDLEERERNVLDKISQNISAKEIVSQSGMPGPEAARALYALMVLGFAVGTKKEVKEVEEIKEVKEVKEEAAKQEPVEVKDQPVVPAPPVAEEEQKAVEAAAAENVVNVQPTLEEIPEDAEEPKETELPAVVPVPLLKANMIAREVLVRAEGIAGERQGMERQLFSEETNSVLVAEAGGVIRLSAAVAPGQLLLLVNVETKSEVMVQVLRKRAYRPTSCYLELDFVEAAPRFWGMEFSAAAALLPKNDKDVETAAMVITAEATADQPWILPTAPDASESQKFKREVEELRRKAISAEMPAMSEEARAVAQLSAEVAKADPIPGPGDPLSTEAILESGLDAASAVAPSKRAADPGPGEAAERVETQQPVSEFIKSLRKSKRWRMPRGNFTPEFNRAMLKLAIVVVVLGIGGTAWFKNWLPWKPAGAKLKNAGAYDNIRVASDAPVTSAATPAKSAPVSDAGATAPVDGSATPVEAASSSAPIEPVATKKKESRATTAAKGTSVRPAPKPAENLEAIPEKDTAVVPPKLIHSVQATVSIEAVRDFERGNVVIDAVVGTSGEVHFISVISGPPSLREAAVESLKEYKYEPATRSGQPVPAHVTITIHFRFEP
jgi:TonB family protein